jgi:hypothetical protein
VDARAGYLVADQRGEPRLFRVAWAAAVVAQYTMLA